MSGVRIVHNKLLGGWFIVRGQHDTPISGRFDSRAAAQAHLDMRKDDPRPIAPKSAVVRINDAFRKAGREERLVRGRGYFYVRCGELPGLTSTSIYSFSLDASEKDYNYARAEINEMFERAGLAFRIEGDK